MTFRRIVANLDFEEELRAHFGAGGPPRTLTAAARRAAAEAGLELRALAREGDRLWLPERLGPGRPESRAGLPVPVLESGPLEDLPPARRLLAWGETPRIAALRERWGALPGPAGPAETARRRALEAPLHDAVWQVPPASPRVVARVAHRGFCLELAQERGEALPGARLVADPEEIEGHLAAGPLRRAGDDRWVVKAPYSAAGRERFVGSGPAALGEPRARRRLERLFEHHGRLVLEPWVERTADFGCAGLVTPEGVRLASVHGQELDRLGRFRGIPRPPAAEGAAGLTPGERDLLESAFHAAGAALRAAGYAGPFGIDAFRWRAPGSGEVFHPLCELNPRLTFGLVARARAERTRGLGSAVRKSGVVPRAPIRRGGKARD